MQTIRPLGTVVLLSTASVVAQEKPDGSNDQPAELKKLVVSADREEGYVEKAPANLNRLGELPEDSPRSVQVVTEKVIEDRAIVDPQEAIQTVSGVQRSAYNTGGGESYLLRGFRQSSFVKDGFRAGTITGGSVLSSAPPTDVANLKAVEVLKGPSAIEFGRGEPGGIVNYVTRLPDFDNSISLQQQIGSHSFYRSQLNANWAAVPDKVALRLDGAYEAGDSFIDYMESERTFLAPSLLWKIDGDTTLTFRGEYTHDDRTTTPGLPYVDGRVLPGIDHDLFMGETDFTNLMTESFRGLLTLEHKWDEQQTTTLSLHGMTSQSHGGYFILANLFGPLQDPVTGDIARSAAGADLNENNFTARIDHMTSWTLREGSAKSAWDLSTVEIKNDLLISLEYDYQSNDNRRELSGHSPLNPYNPVYTGYSPVPLAPFPGFPLIVNETTDTSVETLSLMILDRISFGENIFVTFGARVDSYEASQALRYDSPPFGNTESDPDDVTVNPFVGLVVKPMKDLSLYANFAESTEFLQNINVATVSGDSLDPEETRQFEIGARQQWFDGRLSLSAALFQMNKENVAATDPDNPLFSVNTGEERSRGFELDLVGEPLPGWNVIVNYAYLDAEIVEDPNGVLTGNQSYGVPEHSGGIFTTYEIQDGMFKGLGFGGGVTLCDEVQVDTANTGTLPSYVQADALAYYRRDNWRVQLNVKNLFDEEYYFAQGQGTMVQAAPDRTVLATLKIEF